MNSRIVVIVLSIIIALSIGGYSYSLIHTERIATHWGTNGEVNGTMSKFWGIFLLPILMIVVSAILWWIPRIDPHEKNIALFRKKYEWFVSLVNLFLLYIYVLSIMWNFGYRFSFMRAFSPAFAGLFFSIGYLLKGIKQNWFIGIRTPWTLSSEVVWDKTHQRGSTLFMWCGVIMLLGMIWPAYGVWFLVVPIFASGLYLIVYSYFVYKDEMQKSTKEKISKKKIKKKNVEKKVVKKKRK